MADRKIDVHTHFVPDFYRDALLENGIDHPDGMPGIPAWSPESHLEFMNAVGIQKSILSLSSPGTNFTPSPSYNKNLARQINEYTSTLKKQHPDRFGYFASLPIDPSDPTMSAAITEARYAMDSLDADGFVLLSNTEAVYLGDPKLRPLMEELDSQNAVVFVHPTVSPCCFHQSGNSVVAGPNASEGQEMHKSSMDQYSASSPLAGVYRAPLFEFFFDSARTFLDIINSGTFLRYPRIRWVVSHCGGVLPSLLDRMFLIIRLNQPFTTTRDSIPVTEDQIKNALRTQFYFDLAGNPLPNMVDSLLKFVGTEQLMFGSDVPWTPFEDTKGLVKKMETQLPECIGEEGANEAWWMTAEKLLAEKGAGKEGKKLTSGTK